LNAVAATDTYGLYNPFMATDLNIAGIQQNGSSGSFTYSVIGSGARPITYVSWFDAARFANWMQNGQGSGNTETGAYTLAGQTSGTAPAKNSGAQFYIPTEDQWYKAAYYDPTANGGAGGYWDYATQSDTAPGNTIGSGGNMANIRNENGVFSVTQSSTYDATLNYLTDVGAFSGSPSFYGTFDQSGNVWEWNDLDGTASTLRGARGGDWFNDAATSSSSGRLSDTSVDTGAFSFRLASPAAVPEPSTWVMGLAGLASAGWGMWRRRKTSATFAAELLANNSSRFPIHMNHTCKKFVFLFASLPLLARADLIVDTTYTTDANLVDDYFLEGASGGTVATWTINPGVTVTGGRYFVGSVADPNDGAATWIVKGGGVLNIDRDNTFNLRFGQNNDSEIGALIIQGGSSVLMTGSTASTLQQAAGSFVTLEDVGSTFQWAGTWDEANQRVVSQDGALGAYSLNAVGGALSVSTQGAFTTATVIIPEPSSLLLLAAAAVPAGAVALRRRRSRNRAIADGVGH